MESLSLKIFKRCVDLVQRVMVNSGLGSTELMMGLDQNLEVFPKLNYSVFVFFYKGCIA